MVFFCLALFSFIIIIDYIYISTKYTCGEVFFFISYLLIFGCKKKFFMRLQNVNISFNAFKG